jgi:hypothetical protein
MGLKTLFEAIILQSIEDLWDARHREESIEFLTGQGFHFCAKMAGMGTEERLKLMKFVKDVTGLPEKPRKIKRRSTSLRSQKSHYKIAIHA